MSLHSSQIRGALVLAATLLLGCAEDHPPMLWEAQGAQGGTVYLLGTYHFSISVGEDLAPSVWRGFEQSDAFMSEADTRGGDPLELLEDARMPDGQSLNRLLSEEAWDRLVLELDNVSPGLMAVTRPWVIGAAIHGKLQPTAEAMDVSLLREAQRAGKEASFFETAEWQTQMLNRIPLDEAIAELDEDMRNFDQTVHNMDAILDAYRRGDVEVFLRLTNFDLTSETFDILLRQRNFAWLPQIESLLDGTATTFVAVGVSHVIGTDGLVELLLERGHQIERVLE